MDLEDWRIRPYQPLSLSDPDRDSQPDRNQSPSSTRCTACVRLAHHCAPPDGAKENISPLGTEAHRSNGIFIAARRAALVLQSSMRRILDVELEYKTKYPGLAHLMRSYFETPRTTVGWKGLLNDLDIDDFFGIRQGATIKRLQLRHSASDYAAPITNDMLEAMTPQDLANLSSLVARKAASTEQRLRRELTQFPTNLGLEAGDSNVRLPGKGSDPQALAITKAENAWKLPQNEAYSDRQVFGMVGIDFGTTMSGVSWAPGAGMGGPKQAHLEPLLPKWGPDNGWPPRTWSVERRPKYVMGQKRYFVEGKAGDVPVEAFPDTGADICLMSPDMAFRLGLDIVANTDRLIRLPNKSAVQSPGMVSIPWTFAGESVEHRLDCWVLPGSLHELVLSNTFLRATQTLTKFVARIKSRLVSLPRRLRLRLLGEERQRLWGTLNGHVTAALPDTGSDIMLVSRDYARKIGLSVDESPCNLLEVEFGDGSTACTSGVAWNLPWMVGGRTVHRNFHVLDDLSVDVVLSSDYLFDWQVFSQHSDSLFDLEAGMDTSQLCNIRLIGRFGSALSGLEDEYLEDVTSPEPWGYATEQRELSRRDLIRDKIAALPEHQRRAALDAEAERQGRWQALRDEHRLTVAAGPPGGGSSSMSDGTSQGSSRASDQALTVGNSDSRPLDGTRRPIIAKKGGWWKRKKVVNVSIPLRYLGRS